MDAITYTTARANLADTMDRVCDDHEPIIITRNSQRAVVMMSLDDFKALEETSYLLRSPKNARRLLESIASLEAGQGKERKLAKRGSSFPSRPGKITCVGKRPTKSLWNESMPWLKTFQDRRLRELENRSR